MIVTSNFTVFKYGAKTVGTTAVKLSIDTNTLDERMYLAIANISDSTIYIGDADVTTNDGFPIDPGEKLILATGIDVYAIAAAANKTVRIAEIR